MSVTAATTVTATRVTVNSKILPTNTDETTLATGTIEQIDGSDVEKDGGDDDEAIEKLILDASAGRVSDDEEERDQFDDNEIEVYESEQRQPLAITSSKRGSPEVGIDETPKRRRLSWLQARRSLENSLAIETDTPTKDHNQGRLESPIESPFVSPVTTRVNQSAVETQAPVRATRQRSLGSHRRGALTTASVFPALASARQRKVILPIFTHSDSEGSDEGAANDSDEDYVEGKRPHDTFNLTIYKVPPAHGGTLTVNAVDVVHQVVVNHFSRFLKHNKQMREVRPVVRRAFTRYRTLVHDHLLQLGDLVDSNAVLVARVRATTAARDTARSQLLELRDERMRVQRRMEQVRRHHAEQAAKLNEARQVDFFLADLAQSRLGEDVSTENSNGEDIKDTENGAGTTALNKVLLNLDLIHPKVGKEGAAQLLQKAAQKLQYLDQNLFF